MLCPPWAPKPGRKRANKKHSEWKPGVGLRALDPGTVSGLGLCVSGVGVGGVLHRSVSNLDPRDEMERESQGGKRLAALTLGSVQQYSLLSATENSPWRITALRSNLVTVVTAYLGCVCAQISFLTRPALI